MISPMSAAGIFRDRGVADTGMREIAEAADLSPANLYHYFSGKDEILFYCQDRALDRMLVAVRTSRTRGRSAADRLMSVLAAHVCTLLDEVEGATAHLEVGSLSPARRAQIVRKRDQYELAIRRLIDAGIASREFVRLDSAVATRAMLGAVNWTVTWFRPDGAVRAADIGEIIAAYLVRGLAARC